MAEEAVSRDNVSHSEDAMMTMAQGFFESIQDAHFVDDEATDTDSGNEFKLPVDKSESACESSVVPSEPSVPVARVANTEEYTKTIQKLEYLKSLESPIFFVTVQMRYVFFTEYPNSMQAADHLQLAIHESQHLLATFATIASGLAEHPTSLKEYKVLLCFENLRFSKFWFFLPCFLG